MLSVGVLQGDLHAVKVDRGPCVGRVVSVPRGVSIAEEMRVLSLLYLRHPCLIVDTIFVFVGDGCVEGDDKLDGGSLLAC